MGYGLKITMGESGVNHENNTSVVTVNVYASNTAGYTYWNGYGATVSISCDGQVQNFTIASVNCGVGDTYLGARAFIITHDNDGTKSVGASATFFTGVVGNLSASGSLRLTNIPRATTPTLNYADADKRLGTVLTINTPRASSSFTHTVKYSLGASSGTIKTGVTTSVAWTLPLALANQFTDNETGVGSITVDTYNGSTLIGTKSINFTVKVADDMVPTFTSLTATRVDNGVPSSFGVYVESLSKVTLTITGAVGSYGSTIKSYSISGGGLSTTKSTDTLGPINRNGEVTFTATVTDSRGRQASKSVKITLYAYSLPSVTVIAKRSNSVGTPNTGGTYVAITPTYVVSSVNGKNTITSKKIEIVGTSYSDTATGSGATKVLGSGTIAVNKKYTIKATVTDTIGNTISATTVIDVATAIRNYLASGNGVCFGAYATKQNTLESKWMIDATAGIKSKGYDVPYFTVIETWTE